MIVEIERPLWLITTGLISTSPVIMMVPGFLVDRDPRLGGEHLDGQLLDSADEAIGVIALAGGNRDQDILAVDGRGERFTVGGLRNR